MSIKGIVSPDRVKELLELVTGDEDFADKKAAWYMAKLLKAGHKL